ncbi:hypothetical protein [Nocardia sp. NPDC050793]|uniref:hypothetical protein n=1 Tax=Nocardia sp. NPDC050793 TaxID=3155159 RepID=UPI00340B78C6
MADITGTKPLSKLLLSQQLEQGTSLVSPNGKFTLTLLSDGNALIIGPDDLGKVWNAGVAGQNKLDYGDGTLVSLSHSFFRLNSDGSVDLRYGDSEGMVHTFSEKNPHAGQIVLTDTGALELRSKDGLLIKTLIPSVLDSDGDHAFPVRLYHPYASPELIGMINEAQASLQVCFDCLGSGMYGSYEDPMIKLKQWNLDSPTTLSASSMRNAYVKHSQGIEAWIEILKRRENYTAATTGLVAEVARDTWSSMKECLSTLNAHLKEADDHPEGRPIKGAYDGVVNRSLGDRQEMALMQDIVSTLRRTNDILVGARKEYERLSGEYPPGGGPGPETKPPPDKNKPQPDEEGEGTTNDRLPLGDASSRYLMPSLKRDPSGVGGTATPGAANGSDTGFGSLAAMLPLLAMMLMRRSEEQEDDKECDKKDSGQEGTEGDGDDSASASQADNSKQSDQPASSGSSGSDSADTQGDVEPSAVPATEDGDGAESAVPPEQSDGGSAAATGALAEFPYGASGEPLASANASGGLTDNQTFDAPDLTVTADG